MKYEFVIFDCDGVLVDSEGLSSQVFAAEITRLGWEITAEEVLQRFKGGKFAEALEEIAANVPQPLPADFEQYMRDRTFAAFQESLQPIPGIRSALQALPVPFCVASNGPRNKIELNLGITALLSHFTGRIFSAYELEIWKPDPSFYSTVAKRMGYAREACLVIEDSYAGMQSALGAGMDVWVYSEGHVEDRIMQTGVPTFSDMGALPALLRS